MDNKKVKQSFDDVACHYWNYPKWVGNGLINGWMDYKDGDTFNGRFYQPYVSLTANQLKGK